MLVTSQAWALSPGKTAVSGQVVLCIGHLSFQIEVDEHGAPIGPRMLCEDCPDVQLSGALAEPSFGPAQQVSPATYVSSEATCIKPASASTPWPRAPPIPVSVIS